MSCLKKKRACPENGNSTGEPDCDIIIIHQSTFRIPCININFNIWSPVSIILIYDYNINLLQSINFQVFHGFPSIFRQRFKGNKWEFYHTCSFGIVSIPSWIFYGLPHGLGPVAILQYIIIYYSIWKYIIESQLSIFGPVAMMILDLFLHHVRNCLDNGRPSLHPFLGGSWRSMVQPKGLGFQCIQMVSVG